MLASYDTVLIKFVSKVSQEVPCGKQHGKFEDAQICMQVCFASTLCSNLA